MKLFIFVFTVFFMLTVTLQESLAQAATPTDEAKELLKNFANPLDSFHPQSKAIEAGISELEAENIDAKNDETIAKTRAAIDRHADSNPAKTNKGKTVKDAIGGSKAESER